MADLSIIEFGVYGFVTYSSLLMLIISSIKEIPTTKSQSLLRSMWLIPGIICAVMLMNAGPFITLNDTGSQVIEMYNGTGALISNSTSYPATPNTIQLTNPVWTAIHFMFFVILLVYVLVQMLSLLTKKD